MVREEQDILGTSGRTEDKYRTFSGRRGHVEDDHGTLGGKKILGLPLTPNTGRTNERKE